MGEQINTKVIWQEGMHFSGTANSGFNIQLDAKKEVGGEGKGFLPMELMALSMAGCTAMDVVSILRKKRQEVTGFEVQVDAPRADEHPKVFTRATIEYLVTGHAVDEKAVRRAIEAIARRKLCWEKSCRLICAIRSLRRRARGRDWWWKERMLLKKPWLEYFG